METNNSTTFAPMLATNGTRVKIGRKGSSLEEKEVNDISKVGKLGTNEVLALIKCN
jgi:hypothetical protein